MINNGRVDYDGDLKIFKAEYGEQLILYVMMNQDERVVHPHLDVIALGNGRCIICGNKKQIAVADAVSYISQHDHVKNISIKDSDIDSILKKLF